jgi:chromosome segregation ATPase
MSGNDVRVLQQELFATRQAYARSQKEITVLSAEFKEMKRSDEVCKARLESLTQDAMALRKCKVEVEELEGSRFALQAEVKKLTSARAVLESEYSAARAVAEAKAREAAELQGTLAHQKSKIEDQSTQILLLQRQLADLEDVVRSDCPCLSRYTYERRPWYYKVIYR